MRPAEVDVLRGDCTKAKNVLGWSPKVSFEEMVSFSKKNSSFDTPLWCMDIESGASTGWIATNWLEDLILHEYGPDIYDDWFKQIITSQNNEITLTRLILRNLLNQL